MKAGFAQNFSDFFWMCTNANSHNLLWTLFWFIFPQNGKCAWVDIQQIFLYWWFIMMLVYKASNGSSLWNANLYRGFFKAAMKICLLVEYNHTEKDFMVMCSNYFEEQKLNLLLCNCYLKKTLRVKFYIYF